MHLQGFAQLSLVAYYNNVGTSISGSTALGHLNVWGNSLAADQLTGYENRLGEGKPGDGNEAPREMKIHGVPFLLPPFGTGLPDNVRCGGQYISVAPLPCDWIWLLAAAERRAQDEILIHYVDGSVDRQTLRVSDFWASSAAFGERLGLTSPVMHYPHHVQQGVPGNIWLQRIPVVRLTDLAGFRLPANVAVHIFAATLREQEQALLGASAPPGPPAAGPAGGAR
ncbi:MAG TPA: hypothetical protein VFQ44_08225 [Streptosporangiaceae bacterium]|nr:hypothetical protein [Streptosporangiaceae bacterium]